MHSKAGLSPHLRQRARRRRRSGGPWTVADNGIGAGDPPVAWTTLSGTEFDLRIGETPMNFTGQPESRDHRERLGSGADASLERGRHGHAARGEHARRGRVDSLARHSAAREHGRSPGSQLPRHSPRRDLRVSLRGAAGRHVPVPQSFGISGTARSVWSARHRAARAVALQVRPRTRRDAHRLDGRESCARVCEIEEALGLLQLPSADGRRLLPGRSHAGPQGGARRSQDVGRDADEPDGPRRRVWATPTPT